MDCPRISYYNIKQLNIPDTNLASTVEVNCNISCSLGSVSVCVLHWPRVLWGFFVQMCPRSVLGSRYFLVTLSCTDQTRQMGPGECWLKPGGAQTQRRQWRHQFCVPETFTMLLIWACYMFRAKGIKKYILSTLLLLQRWGAQFFRVTASIKSSVYYQVGYHVLEDIAAIQGFLDRQENEMN